MSRILRGFDVQAAHEHLSRADRKLATWMQRIGPIEADPRWKKPFDVCDALARAILYQQLSGKAAETITNRLLTAIGGQRIHGASLDAISDEAVRACGVSGNKLLALRDLAERDQRGDVPDCKTLARMDDESIIATLTPIRGIGRWTVEMMLMFRLGRADVLPVDDLGIRKGAQRVDKRAEMQKPRALAERGERWGPYRSYASFYLWRIADFSATPKPAVKRSQS